jgi:hypothetical protein
MPRDTHSTNASIVHGVMECRLLAVTRTVDLDAAAAKSSLLISLKWFQSL